MNNRNQNNKDKESLLLLQTSRSLSRNGSLSPPRSLSPLRTNSNTGLDSNAAAAATATATATASSSSARPQMPHRAASFQRSSGARPLSRNNSLKRAVPRNNSHNGNGNSNSNSNNNSNANSPNNSFSQQIHIENLGYELFRSPPNRTFSNTSLGSHGSHGSLRSLASANSHSHSHSRSTKQQLQKQQFGSPMAQSKASRWFCRAKNTAFLFVIATLLFTGRSLLEFYLNASTTITTKTVSTPSSTPSTPKSSFRGKLTSMNRVQQPQNTPPSSNNNNNNNNSNIAYAWLLAGIPTTTTPTTTATQQDPYLPEALSNQRHSIPNNAYRGLLYNILVSVEILRQSGSHADMIVLVHTLHDGEELLEEDSRLLRDMQIQIHYIPSTPNPISEFSTLSLEKFRILEFIQYDRILYMDADVTPHCNLDYLMELSLQPSTIMTTTTTTTTPMLQPNVAISIDNMPTSTQLFVLAPQPGDYLALIKFIAAWPVQRNSFDNNKGWGSVMAQLQQHPWRVLAGDRNGTDWSFEGAESDPGLLFYYLRFIKQNFTHIVGDEVELWSQGRKTNTLSGNQNPVQQHSCLSPQAEQSGIGKMWYDSDELRQAISPAGVAPYRDFAQWQYNLHRPWHYQKAPAPVSSTTLVRTARKFWFYNLRLLDSKLNMGLDFQNDPDNVSPAEKIDGAPNWNYIVEKPTKNLTPVWSQKVQSLQQWALRQTNSSLASLAWEPPILKRKVAAPDAATLRTKCQCSDTVSTDPCSITHESLEDWLSRRVPFRLSKQRPLCPNALQNTMHILVPFFDLDVDTLQTATCSIVCQDYPPEKLHIYLYDDGSSKSSLQDVCEPEDIMDFSPLSPGKDGSEEPAAFDNTARKHASESMKRFRGQRSKMTFPITTCIKAKDHIGPGGAKYFGFRLVEASAAPNDVVVVVDGDDELYHNKALQTINRKYITTAAFSTYGTYEGKYSEQTQDLPREVLTGKAPFNPRRNQPDWRFGHARTFKAHLLRHIGLVDFIDKGSDWLIKATDRGFLYRVLELSGPKRIAYIPDKIYKYYWSATTSTVAVVPKEIRTAQLEHVQSLEPSVPLSLPLNIIMVYQHYVELLQEQLLWIQQQSLAENRQLVVHLLCSNAKVHDQVSTVVKSFLDTNKPADNIPIDVTVVLNQQSRIMYVHDLRKREPVDQIFFLDEDLYFTPDFIESIVKRHQPASMATWNGKVFDDKVSGSRDIETGLAMFEASALTWNDTVTQRKTYYSTMVYGGLGGSVLDANLWLLDQQLQRDDYHEEMWVSYIVDALLGWDILRQEKPLPVRIPLTEQGVYSKTLLASLPDGHAQKILALGKATAEKMLSEVGGGEEADMFEDMQKRFHWNVFRPASKSQREIIKAGFALPSAPANKSKSKKEKRAYVCVTGQFDRFELQLKIQNLLLPLSNAGYDIDVALVLSAGEAVYTNKKATEFAPFYTEFEDAIKDLQSNKLNVLSLNGTYPKLAKPYVNKKYFKLLYDSQKAWRSEEDQLNRVQNHARIFESYLRCLDYADNAAQKAGTSLEEYYDVVIRIRDDVALNLPLQSEVMKSLIPPPTNSLAVTECRSWHGMNDRLAIVSPDIAREYFSRPYELFVNNSYVDPKIVRNPESFLLYALTSAKTNVLGHPQLKRLNRVVNYGDGKPSFYNDDKFEAGCPKPFTYLQRNSDLYGWGL